MTGCSNHPSLPQTYDDQTGKLPQIYPDYTFVTIPKNIAPTNFMIKDAEECVAEFCWDGGTQTYGHGNKVQIPSDEWKKIMDEATGKKLTIHVYTRQGELWTRYKPFEIRVAQEEIDPYISYRVISPSYIAYEMLSINQRCLTNFEEKVIYNNMLVSNETTGQCINCHSYQNYRTDNM